MGVGMWVSVGVGGRGSVAAAPADGTDNAVNGMSAPRLVPVSGSAAGASTVKY
jgi:hypothetical protein